MMADMAIFAGLLSLLLFAHAYGDSRDTVREVHIVYMGERLQDEDQAAASHRSILRQATQGYIDEADNLLLYSYKRSFNGFAAYLTHQESQHLSGKDGIVSIFPSKKYELQTTRSWDFMAFPRSVERAKQSAESDIVVGLLDSGINPEAQSFHDNGLGPPPKKWKGKCETYSNFTCNNKIIGSRVYGKREENWSPRDIVRHGTPTASTAAGREVAGVSLYGLSHGTARGAVPSARIAMYKVVNLGGAYDEDLLAAMDDAIADGVDIISLSVGAGPSHYTRGLYMANALDIGSFHAMKEGILVCASAGNFGPRFGDISNIMPWVLTVAGSTIDRSIVNKIVLGNGQNMTGKVINTFASQKKLLPFVSPEESCQRNGSSFSPPWLRGKVVLCEASDVNLADAFPVDAAGFVLCGDSFEGAHSYPFPASVVYNGSDCFNLLQYVHTTAKRATAKILRSEVIHDSKAPLVASFSSRGPNPHMLDILKPDITAPGVEILTAWPPVASMSGLKVDKRSVRYNILSGTSIACPHVAGAAAYVKSFHPNWSPAAIKSALMTTAYSMNVSSSPAMELGYGSGHVNPLGALDPGLVYDASERDYVDALCHLGYNQTRLGLITGDNSSCIGGVSMADGIAWGLNYPSISLSAYLHKNMRPVSATFPRTVTNVGVPSSTYRVRVINHNEPDVKITVEPPVLHFNELYQKRSFVVKVFATAVAKDGIVSASMVWSDGSHRRVVSPIVLHHIALTTIISMNGRE